MFWGVKEEGGRTRKCRLPGKKLVTLPSSSLGKGYLGADKLIILMTFTRNYSSRSFYQINVVLKVGIQQFPRRARDTNSSVCPTLYVALWGRRDLKVYFEKPSVSSN